ncbi:MAG: serine/threonine-protein kinase [Planctomycetota bacterium]
MAEILQEVELGVESSDESNLSEEEIKQLGQAKRALARLERLSGSMNPQALHDTSVTDQAPTETPTSRSTRDSEVEWDELLDAAAGFPRSLGRFEVQDVLGRSGFGVVLQARDPKIDQLVALKIPRSELLVSEEGRERLYREARAATILSHPGVVPIYESGSVGVVPYISFGYCSGPTLDKWMERKSEAPSANLVAKMGVRLADAIQHAHSRDIVHRDLKPSNVILADTIDSHHDEQHFLLQLRIADFGLAGFQSGESGLTKTGSPMGTPAYMSPEQARGERDIGPRSDVFSLGLILYELLTQTHPFRQSSDLATLRAVEESHPAAASKVRNAVPKDLSAILERCMEKKQADRYRSAQDLADDLTRFLDGEPVVARPVGKLTRAARWCKRNPIVAGSLAGTVASLFAGLVVSLSYAQAAWESERVATQNTREANRRYQEALALSGLFHQTYDSFRSILQEDLKGGDEKAKAMKAKLVDSTKQHYQMVAAKRPTDSELLREYVNMLRPMALQLQRLGDQQTSSEIWLEAAGILETEFPEDVSGWAATMGKLVEDYIVLQRSQDAVLAAKEIVERLQKADVKDENAAKTQTQLVHALTNASMAFKKSGKLKDALSTLDEATEIVCQIENVPIENWPAKTTWARLIRTKCELIDKLDRYDELELLIPIGIRQYEALKENPKYLDLCLDSMASLYNARAGIQQFRKNHEEAMEQFGAALELRNALIERHPEMGWLYYNAANNHQRIAQVLNATGHYEQAATATTEQLERLSKFAERFPEMTPAFTRQEVEAYWTQSIALQKLGKKAESIAAAERGIGLVEKLIEASPDGSGLEGRLGTLYHLVATNSEDAEQKKEAIRQAIAFLDHACEQGDSTIFQSVLDEAKKIQGELE